MKVYTAYRRPIATQLLPSGEKAKVVRVTVTPSGEETEAPPACG
jgi:hypothetical protein